MNLAEATIQATEIMAALGPYCERLAIAGSVRRLKSDNIKDVELVLIPNPKYLRELANLINGKWGAPSIGKWPAKYTKIRAAYSIDIFTGTKANWGLLLFIRSGPAEYVTKALAEWKKLTAGGYSEGAILHYADGIEVPTLEETDVFRALQRKYVPPEKRF